MEDGGPSQTARRVAAHRLDFTRVPADYGDPAADQALAVDVAAGHRVPAGRMHDYLAARTSFFDRTVVGALGRGVRQVVVGAAGYDGRAFRYAALIAAAGFAVLIGAIMALLPELGHLAVNQHLYGNHATETPLPLKNAKGVIVYPGFPADVLFNFRLYSIASQLVLWGAIGLIFAPLADRLLAPGPARAELRQVRETAGV
jgi:hypothetical protein